MNTHKFSPGWHLVGSRRTGFTIHGTLPDGSDTGVIATFNNPSRDTNEANARLAVASPELLQALEKMLKLCEGGTGNALQRMDSARAAIADATP